MYFVGSILVKIKSKLKSICFKCANFLAEKIPKEKKKKQQKFSNVSVAVTFWEGPRKTELNSTRRITELKLQIVLKEGGGGSHELILSLESGTLH